MSPARPVIVSLDYSSGEITAAEAAAQLAAALETGLVGVFVEEQRWLALADNPLVRVANLHSGAFQPLDPAMLRRRIQIQTRRTRANLQRIAEHRGVELTFRSVQVTQGGELRSAYGEAEVVSVTRRSGPLRAPQMLGEETRALLDEPATDVLITSSGHPLGPPIVLVRSVDPPLRALEIAGALAAATGWPLDLLAVADDDVSAGRIAEETERALARHRVRLRAYGQLPADPAALRETLREHPAGLLVIEERSSRLDRDALIEWIERSTSAVLMASER